MNALIKNAILNGRLCILLGAGASCSSRNKSNSPVPTGYRLAEILSEKAGLEMEENDQLSDIYAAAHHNLGNIQIIKVLEDQYKNCQPSGEYIALSNYPFSRIYTFNIDDALEVAFKQSPREFHVKRRNNRIEEIDSFYTSTTLIKLNGDINVPEEGFIFSPSEYGEGSAKEPFWYKELAQDFHKYTFLFIGTQLKEPLFEHQIEKYKARTKENSGRSYLIVPSLSPAQKGRLEASNIEYIPGSLQDFITWLKLEFPEGLSAKDILQRVKPEMSIEFSTNTKNKIFENVVPVNRSSLITSHVNTDTQKIRSFYKGFKPTWIDILDNVPAYLENTDKLYKKILNPINDTRLFVITGPAGTGKTTALKQLALKISETTNNSVFYVDAMKQNILELVKTLNSKLNSKYFIIIERLADMAPLVSEILKSNLEYVNFIGAENIKIWKDRGEEHFSETAFIIEDFNQISTNDADPILQKLELYGNWTRLSKMSIKNRRLEIMKKSKRQLLIGLLEATSGEGFYEIIKNDYKNIKSDAERSLLLLTGLATLQGTDSSEATLTRALSFLDLNPNVSKLVQTMPGVLNYQNGLVSARHRVYIEQILSFISLPEIYNILIAYIQAFCVYNFPIVKNVSAKDATIYKGLVNFKLLKKLLKDDKNLILNIYSNFEKQLEQEGFFLLQYGLALRAYNNNNQALEKISLAREAFPESPHIEHAYAQQLLIIAEQTFDEVLALQYLERVIEILERLEKINRIEGDRYPIITLSIGHVRVLHKHSKKDDAKRYAKYYYDQLRFKFKNQSENSRIRETKHFLLRYYTSGAITEPRS